MRKISEGAEAEIYDSMILGIAAVVKDRIAKGYRTPVLDSQIRETRTKTEARILATASSNGINAPKVLMVNKHQIFMSKLDGRMLNTMLDAKGKSLEQIIIMAARELAALHGLGIVHGDYTPANILVDKQKVWIIDFGLGGITNSAEEKALDLLLMKRSVSKELYSLFEKEYVQRNKMSGGAVVDRLAAIERRGRYQTRTLASK